MQEFLLKNAITIVFLLLLLYSFVRGFSQGFLKKILSFGSIIVTIIATRFFTPVAANMVKDATNFESTLTAIIYDAMIKNNLYDQINVPWLSGSIDTGNIQENLKNGLCTSMANAIINILCGIVVFIIILILIKIILKVLDVVDFIPVVGQLNKILGGAFGVLEFIMVIWILFAVFRALENVQQLKILTDNIKDSAIVGMFYKNNIVYNFFANVFSASGSAT